MVWVCHTVTRRSVKMEEHEANSSSDSEAEDLRLLALIDQTRAKVMVLPIIVYHYLITIML